MEGWPDMWWGRTHVRVGAHVGVVGTRQWGVGTACESRGGPGLVERGVPHAQGAGGWPDVVEAARVVWGRVGSRGVATSRTA